MEVLNFVPKISLNDFMTILLFLFIAWVIHTIKYNRRLPPGPWGIPILGYLPFMKTGGAPHLRYLRMSAKYGDIFSVKLGRNLIMCIGSAKMMKVLFCRHDSTGRPDTPMNNLLGGLGIVMSEGALWKVQRQFLHEKFRKLGVRLMPNQRFEKFIMMELEELLETLDKSEGKHVDPTIILGRHMHNIICQIMMSFRFEKNSEKFVTFNENIARGMKLYGTLHFGEHMKAYLKLPGKQAVIKEIQRNLNDISEFHMNQLIERKNQRKIKSSHKPADLLDCYLEQIENEKNEVVDNENDKKAPDIFPGTDREKQIVQVMNDLFSAGMETSRSALVWCLIMMMTEPQVAQKVREELRKHVGIGRTVTLEHRQAIPYVEAIIYETLRTVSLVPLGSTHVNTREWKIENYIIPAGTHIVPLMNKMNVDPELYPEPNKYKPERFINNGKLKTSDILTQFGVGQRMCLGTQLARMELFLFFANLMNHYEFYMPEGREIPGLDGVWGSVHSPLPFEMCFKKIQPAIHVDMGK